MGERERDHDLDQIPQRHRGQHQRRDEEQVIVAAQDVQDPLAQVGPGEARAAGRAHGGAVEVDGQRRGGGEQAGRASRRP